MRDMDRKMNVLGVQVDDYSAKEAMRRAIEYLQTEAINVIEMLTTDVLVKSSVVEGVKQNTEEADMILIGDKAILEAAGIQESKRLQEAAEDVFLKMFLRYLEKNRKRIWLMADSQEELDSFEEILHERYPKVKIMGGAVVPEHAGADDMIVNEINGLEIDCILSELDLAGREAFIARNRIIVNARVWLRVGKQLRLQETETGFKKSVYGFVRKFILKKEIERENRRRDQ